MAVPPPFASLLVLGLTLAPAREERASARVGVVEVALDPSIAEQDQALLRARYVEGLTRAGFEVVDLEETSDCRTGPCLRELAAGAGVSLLTRAHIGREQRDYTISAELLDGASAQILVEDGTVCELCGLVDVAERTSSLAGRLRQRLDNQTLPARLRVVSDPVGAMVLVDGIEVGRTPLDAPIDPGAHVLSVRAKNHQEERQDVELAGGETGSFAFSLAPVSRVPRWAPAVAIGVGVAAIASGAVLLGLHGRPIRRDCVPDINGACQRLHRTLGGGVVMTVAGVSLVGAGIGLSVWRRRDTRRGDTALGVQWSQRF